MTEEPHLTSEDVAAYLDDALSESDTARIRSHLAACETCRSEISSVSQLLDRAPSARRRFAVFPALAAAAVVMVVLGRQAIDRNSTSEQLRGNTTPTAHEGVSGFKAIAPRDRLTVRTGTVFVWRPPLPGASYRFTLTDEHGGRIWTGSTNDTTITLPDGILLRQDQSYHWFVDAVLPDGSAATTGITSFQVAR